MCTNLANCEYKVMMDGEEGVGSCGGDGDGKWGGDSSTCLYWDYCCAKVYQ